MKCLVRNITGGTVHFKDLELQRGEQKKVQFNDRIRTYVAQGIVKLLEIYPSTEKKSEEKED